MKKRKLKRWHAENFVLNSMWQVDWKTKSFIKKCSVKTLEQYLVSACRGNWVDIMNFYFHTLG